MLTKHISGRSDEPSVIVEDLSGGYYPLVVFRDVELTVELAIRSASWDPMVQARAHFLKRLPVCCRRWPAASFSTVESSERRAAYERARAGLVLVPEGRQILANLTVRQNLELSRAARQAQLCTPIRTSSMRCWQFSRDFRNAFRKVADR